MAFERARLVANIDRESGTCLCMRAEAPVIWARRRGKVHRLWAGGEFKAEPQTRALSLTSDHHHETANVALKVLTR